MRVIFSRLEIYWNHFLAGVTNSDGAGAPVLWSFLLWAGVFVFIAVLLFTATK